MSMGEEKVLPLLLIAPSPVGQVVLNYETADYRMDYDLLLAKNHLLSDPAPGTRSFFSVAVLGAMISGEYPKTAPGNVLAELVC